MAWPPRTAQTTATAADCPARPQPGPADGWLTPWPCLTASRLAVRQPGLRGDGGHAVPMPGRSSHHPAAPASEPWPGGGTGPGQQGRGGICGCAGGTGQHAGISVGGQRDRRVPELILDHLQVRPGGEREGRRAVPQPVQSDRRQPGLVHQAAEQPGQPVRPDRCPGADGEHVPGLSPSRSCGGMLGPLAGLVSAQRRDGGRIQRDHPPACLAFRRPGYQPPAQLLQLPGHRQRARIQVLPPQPGHLTPAQPAQRHQVKHPIQPVPGHQPQELTRLLRRPHAHGRAPAPLLPPRRQRRRPHLRPRPRGSGQLRPPARVGRDQPGADRGVQRRPQRGVDPPQRRRAHRTARRRVAADDPGEHALHISSRQLRQRDGTQVRDQVTADMRGIPAPGRGPQRHPPRQPPLQPLPRPHASCRARSRARQCLQRRERRRPAHEPAPAHPPPLPRRRRQLDGEIPRPVPHRAQLRAAHPEQPSSHLVPAAAPPEHRTTIHGPSPESPGHVCAPRGVHRWQGVSLSRTAAGTATPAAGCSA